MNQKTLLPIVTGVFLLYLISRSKKVSGSPGQATIPIVPNTLPSLPPAQTPSGGGGGSGTGAFPNVPGSAGESYLGNSALPRGIRNNNPGNFKMSSAAWQGKIPQQDNTDGTFQQYYYFPMGVRMMIKELKNNYINAGYNTIDSILDRYDPPGNPNYKSYVSQRTGFGINDPLIADKKTLKSLVQAITRFENGYTGTGLVGASEVVSDATFNYAYTLI